MLPSVADSFPMPENDRFIARFFSMPGRVMPIGQTLFSVLHTSCEETIATVNAADYIVRSAERSTSG
jgi:hypothetical protein